MNSAKEKEMRYPIIDTTRTYTVERDAYGEDNTGWSVVEHCPVNGIYVWPCIHDTYQEARDSLEAFFAD
jgi:hypothetical protein